MPSKPDGGYAFPQALDSQTSFVGGEGMSLRDYFAAKALAGILANPERTFRPTPTDDVTATNTAEVIKAYARVAYVFADALLAARG